jgi:hypothetical protein
MVQWHLAGVAPLVAQRQGGENTALQILGRPPEMLQNGSDREKEGTKAFGKQVY